MSLHRSRFANLIAPSWALDEAAPGGGTPASTLERSRFIREGCIYRGAGAPRKVLSISYAGNVRWIHVTDDPRDQPLDSSLDEFERWAGFSNTDETLATTPF